MAYRKWRDGFFYKRSRGGTGEEPWPWFFESGDYMTSDYGWRPNPFPPPAQEFHGGVDYIPAGGGDPTIHAQFYGTAVTVNNTNDPIYGLYVDVLTDQGFLERYQHNDSNLIAQGTRVEPGMPIAIMGRSGAVTGAHLHYTIYEPPVPLGGNRIDPHTKLGR